MSEDYKIIHGDSLDENLIEDGSIDLTVTSPPYNLGMEYTGNSEDDLLPYKEYLAFSTKWLSNVYRWTRDTGRLCLNTALDLQKGKTHYPVYSDITTIAQEIGWVYRTAIVWDKKNISSRTAWGSWRSPSAPNILPPVEMINVFHKPPRWKRDYSGPKEETMTKDEFVKWTNGLWSIAPESAKGVGHDCPFPRELPYRCIRMFSYSGDTVLDPFCGSGTTILEAVANGRNAIGIEKEERYYNLAMNRMENSTENLNIFGDE